MANPTTPFSWQMPTATDLVTDLPADFEVFGQAVATSMGDLLGGTTGQVLSKTSATDMAFTWVAQDDSNAIQNAIVTAKGNLIGASASATPLVLAVGTNGQTLVADSTASTGLKWATPAGGGGKVLQVVGATTTTDTNITTTTFTDTTITATITPTLATSKILVIINYNAYLQRTANEMQAFGKILRGATNIYENEIMRGYAPGVTSLGSLVTSNITFYDSPATTSSTTYKLQAKVDPSTSSALVNFQKNNNLSTITLLEIGA